MADNLTPEQRSYSMSRIRSKRNQTTELRLRSCAKPASKAGGAASSFSANRTLFSAEKELSFLSTAATGMGVRSASSRQRASLSIGRQRWREIAGGIVKLAGCCRKADGRFFGSGNTLLNAHRKGALKGFSPLSRRESIRSSWTEQSWSAKSSVNALCTALCAAWEHDLEYSHRTAPSNLARWPSSLWAASLTERVDQDSDFHSTLNSTSCTPTAMTYPKLGRRLPRSRRAVKQAVLLQRVLSLTQPTASWRSAYRVLARHSVWTMQTA